MRSRSTALRRGVLLSMLFAAPAWAGGRLIVVVGAEGEPGYGRQFAQWADRWAVAAEAGGLRVERIGPGAPTTRPATSPASAPSTAPATDKDRLHAALAADTGPPGAPLWLVLIGHGTAEGDAKFNLTGPDVSDRELAEWLKPMKRPLAVVVCASASGPFVNRLSAPGRVVVTATKAGSEDQFSRFGDAISAAIADASADLDKDGQTSLLEAFLAASHRTESFYKQAGRLATEHALLDDNGDGRGVSADWFRGVRPAKPAADGAAVDGPKAQAWCLVPGTQPALTPEQSARRDRLEADVEALRGQKPKLADGEYYARLEKLMVELAGVCR